MVAQDTKSKYSWECRGMRVNIGLGPTLKYVAVTLLRYGNNPEKNYQAYPGVRKLANALECCEKSVRIYLEDLEAKGVIVRVSTGNGRGNTTYYDLTPLRAAIVQAEQGESVRWKGGKPRPPLRGKVVSPKGGKKPTDQAAKGGNGSNPYKEVRASKEKEEVKKDKGERKEKKGSPTPKESDIYPADKRPDAVLFTETQKKDKEILYLFAESIEDGEWDAGLPDIVSIRTARKRLHGDQAELEYVTCELLNEWADETLPGEAGRQLIAFATEHAKLIFGEDRSPKVARGHAVTGTRYPWRDPAIENRMGVT